MRDNPVTTALLYDQALNYVLRLAEIGYWVASVIKHEDEAGRLV